MDIEKVIEATENAFDLVHSDFIGTEDFDENEWVKERQCAIEILKDYKEGTWIHHCSAIGKKEECSFCHLKSSSTTPYCPWCGTKMLRVITTFE